MNTVLLASLEPLALQGNVKLAVASIFGIVLGLVLVKCDFADRVLVKKNLTFASMKMAKTLLLALGIGMMAFALLRSTHAVQSNVTPAAFWGVLLGGLCTGIGLGIGGLVPVTAVAALASGRIYALWVLLGMLLAIPAAKLFKRLLPEAGERFSAPVSASLEPANGLFALNSPVLWVSAAALILCLIMMLFGNRDE
ncbi:MAG: hypothetical protein E7047_04400 [Lentisphaerae bacterium]|nr:hypothetical protein [Lentisphaerota bacterium]